MRNMMLHYDMHTLIDGLESSVRAFAHNNI